MPKNIIFCADGTWDSPTEKDAAIVAPTNVSKLYALLINDGITQVAAYDDGIGTSDNELIKLFEGMTGAGLAAKIIDGYQYILNQWQPGDRVFLFGFSRGAYTVRCLGAMIAQCGLLPNIEDESHLAQRLRVIAVYLAYRKSTLETTTNATENQGRLCPIQMIGVWETVGALGIPLKALKQVDYTFFNFHNTQLHSNVRYGYQALAIDEARASFAPTLWDSREGIEQVWFIGSHADVGGGYAIHGLSDLALHWMLTKALSAGVMIQAAALLNGAPLLEGNPYDAAHDPWNQLPFSLLPVLKRVIPAGSDIHHSVALRMQNTALHYHPSNLPLQPKIV